LPNPVHPSILGYMASTPEVTQLFNQLSHAIVRYTEKQSSEGPYYTSIEELVILRSEQTLPPFPVLFKPSLCLVVQGAKTALFGDERFDYQAGQALVITIDMPVLGRVAQASQAQPFLGLIIAFDVSIMREAWQNLHGTTQTEPSDSSLLVVDVDGPLADCALRLVELLDHPQAIPTLLPLLKREISYWLLTGPHGSQIAKIALAPSHEPSVLGAIHTLRTRFTQTVRMDELAEAARLSSTAFYRQFKALTAMSPLQYQKQLRLLEARRLMMDEGTNVETAAFQVGYESPSQFSREYTRVFGLPPRRDIERMKVFAS